MLSYFLVEKLLFVWKIWQKSIEDKNKFAAFPVIKKVHTMQWVIASTVLNFLWTFFTGLVFELRNETCPSPSHQKIWNPSNFHNISLNLIIQRLFSPKHFSRVSIGIRGETRTLIFSWEVGGWILFQILKTRPVSYLYKFSSCVSKMIRR